ncbi:MAG: hypothetical protein ACOCWM_03780 [Cyclobacteriaceae bacterium]
MKNTIVIGAKGTIGSVISQLLQTKGRRILFVHPPFVKETTEAMQMDGSQNPSASEVALVYLQGLENAENGKTSFLNKKHIINQ